MYAKHIRWVYNFWLVCFVSSPFERQFVSILHSIFGFFFFCFNWTSLWIIFRLFSFPFSKLIDSDVGCIKKTNIHMKFRCKRFFLFFRYVYVCARNFTGIGTFQQFNKTENILSWPQLFYWLRWLLYTKQNYTKNIYEIQQQWLASRHLIYTICTATNRSVFIQYVRNTISNTQKFQLSQKNKRTKNRFSLHFVAECKLVARTTERSSANVLTLEPKS